MFSATRTLDPTETLQKEYDDKLYYKLLVSVAISQGQYEVVSKFLEKVPRLEKKGI